MNTENNKTIYRQNGLVKTFKGDVLFEKGRIDKQGKRIGKWLVSHDKTLEEAFYENGRLVRSTLSVKQKFWEKFLRPARVLRETFYDPDGSSECQKYDPQTDRLVMKVVSTPGKGKALIFYYGETRKIIYRDTAGKLIRTEVRNLYDNTLMESTQENHEKKIDCFYDERSKTHREEIYFKKTKMATIRYYKKGVLMSEKRTEGGRDVWRDFFGGKKLACYWKELAGGSFIGERFNEKGQFIGWCFSSKRSSVYSYKGPVEIMTYPTKEKVYRAFVGELINQKISDKKRQETLSSLRQIKSLSARKCWLLYLKSLQHTKK